MIWFWSAIHINSWLNHPSDGWKIRQHPGPRNRFLLRLESGGVRLRLGLSNSLLQPAAVEGGREIRLEKWWPEILEGKTSPRSFGWWCQNWSRLGILSIMIVAYCSWSRLYSETDAVVFGNLYSETNTVVFGNLYSETNAVVFGNLWQELMIHHVLGTKCLFPLTCMWVLCRSFVHTPAFDELGTHRLHWSWSVVRIQIRLTCEIFSLLYCAQWQWNGQVVKRLNLNLNVGSHAQVHRRSQLCFVSYQDYACICQRELQFWIFLVEKKRVVQRGRKFVLLVNKNAHVFARGGGNCELFWWKKKHVVQRGGKFVLSVHKNMHVFARGGGNFELFWWKKEPVVQRGGNYVLLVSRNMHVFARGVGNFELPSNHDIVVQRGSQVCFVRWQDYACICQRG